MPRQGGSRNEPDTTILEDDVLVPAAGILDVLDNCAFVRTSGYLPGPEDVYLSLSMVRKYHLRRGDAVVGQVRQPREGERREKFNPMVRIDSVNGTEAEGAKERPEFADAVPVHPHQRLRLASDADLIGRVVDVAAPVGKGQRGLVLAPPRTGATTLFQSIAQSVTANNPECHVMVVLVDTRPEEVTDYQRAVKGEVVASTFDRQPADHTLVAELAIERAKRLVELGHDVVVLLDSLTRLGRAYNLAAPANGRVLAGLVDASAVHPTKEFFGAARAIEDGGSLTILATVAVGTGSATDEFFLEELAGAANLELVLSAERAAKGIVPAVDVAASGTRHEEKLLAPAEGAVVGDLRKQLAAADSPQAVDQGRRRPLIRGSRPRESPDWRRCSYRWHTCAPAPVHVTTHPRGRPGAIREDTMKKDTHPEYVETQVTCTCGASFTTRSTATSGSIHADVCSQCHPFYTGKQKILDTGGRVARFEARYAKKAPAETK